MCAGYELLALAGSEGEKREEEEGRGRTAREIWWSRRSEVTGDRGERSDRCAAAGGVLLLPSPTVKRKERGGRVATEIRRWRRQEEDEGGRGKETALAAGSGEVLWVVSKLAGNYGGLVAG
ncbi:hypothetical protein HAX54_013063, partial [Datura stramonium]|nr:hypothetical protein [Datura stramonium]